jgi:hypothetical protein
MLQSESLGTNAFGVALIGLGVKYVPLLIQAIDLVRQSAIEAAIADESGDRRALYARYRHSRGNSSPGRITAEIQATPRERIAPAISAIDVRLCNAWRHTRVTARLRQNRSFLPYLHVTSVEEQRFSFV